MKFKLIAFRYIIIVNIKKKMIANTFRKLDAFGYQVSFTMKSGNGSQQTSIFGGIVTLLIYSFMAIYVYIKIQKMTAGSLDNITQMEQLTDYQKLQKVNMKGISPYFNIMYPINSSIDLSEYISVQMFHLDGYTGNMSQKYFRRCQNNDFLKFGLKDVIESEVEQAKNYNYSLALYCIDNFEDAFLSSRMMDFNFSSIILSVNFNQNYT